MESIPMTAAQLFGVVVRTVGLLMAIYGTIASCFGLIVIAWGSVIPLVFGLPAMLIGLWLLRGPQSLIAYAYPDRGPGG
jgi:hypothetical protein